ncbi:hypothetical protein N9E86_00710 [Alphaproteobacteria bacterium]|nr:hypothetical protein [Alphaproteobacteria bacterium]
MTTNLSSMALHITVFGAVFSFGTFGFLNLFDARLLFQGLYLIFIVIFGMHYLMFFSFTVQDIIFACFFLLLSCGNYYNSGYWISSLEYLLVIIVFAIMKKSENALLKRVLHNLLFVFLFFYGALLIAFCFYQLFPDTVSSANIYIYDSTTGSAKVTPGHFIDWFSFTSGDGFVLWDNVFTRLKGYSNEPSSTIVHYLVPSIIAFWLGGRYALLGCAILFINIFAISSVVSILIIGFSLLFWFFSYIKMLNNRPVYLFAMSVAFLFFLSGKAFMEVLILMFESTGTYLDLFTRKIAPNGSLDIRYQGIVADFGRVLSSPVGFSSDLLGAGSGLLYVFSSKVGYVGAFMCFYFIVKFTSLSVISLQKTRKDGSGKLAVCLSLVHVYFAFFVSGYGWDRFPGLIFLFLIFFMINNPSVLRDGRVKYKFIRN